MIGPRSPCHVAQPLDRVHRGTLPLGAGATFCRRGARPSGDLVLTPLDGEGRTVSEWLTNFHLLLVCLDPYTNESAWVLDAGDRILSVFRTPTCGCAGSSPPTPTARARSSGRWRGSS